MKTTSIIILLLFCFIMTSQTVKIKKKPTIISVVHKDWITTEKVTHSYHTGDKALGAVTGAGIGYLLFGDAMGTMGGAMVGAAATQDEIKTYITYEKRKHCGWEVTVSDGYTFITEDDFYAVGQTVKYEE